jgi:hypothetical protein
MSIITGLQEENTLLKSKLENMTKSVRMLNNGSNVLDENIRPYCYKLYGYPQPQVQLKVGGKSVQAREEWKPKTPSVSSSMTSSVSISVPPILTKSSNLVESVSVVYNPHSMSKFHVEPLKNHNVKPNVKLSGMVSVVADNINEESVFVTHLKLMLLALLRKP